MTPFQCGHIMKICVFMLMVQQIYFMAGLLRSFNCKNDRQEMGEIKTRLDLLKEMMLNEKKTEDKYDRDNINDKNDSLVAKNSLSHEEDRRQLMKQVNEMWWYARSNLVKSMTTKSRKVKRRLETTLEDLRQRKMSMLKILSSDNHEAWRKDESNSLSDLVHARLYFLQNPSHCSSAKKLLCNVNGNCGFGCQIHHALSCFLLAYGTERMMVLKFKHWGYNETFEDIFLPLSESCKDLDLTPIEPFPGTELSTVVEFQSSELFSHIGHKFFPPSIPSDISDRLVLLHGEPVVWWVSQFLKYLLRPKYEIVTELEDIEEEIGFQHPIVGMHVRRTDKILETSYYEIDEYMYHVEEFYKDLQSLNNGNSFLKKRVYLASDDPKVYRQCKKKYPEYIFLESPKPSKAFASKSLYNIVMDLHFLSRSDYLVGTFTSNLGLLAYEIMQQMHVDASDQFHSLDFDWQFWGQGYQQQVATMDHEARDDGEIQLRVGDLISLEHWNLFAGEKDSTLTKAIHNEWNGLSIGRNHRTGIAGRFPGYKTKKVGKTCGVSCVSFGKIK